MYIAECLSIPGCVSVSQGQTEAEAEVNVADAIRECLVSQGQTEAEAEVNVADAIRECLAARAELGMPLTVTTREVEIPV
jgi:predicted RNase H-like HicB family nuclease